MVNVVPNDAVVSTSRCRASDGEDEPRIKRPPQQLSDVFAVVVVRQERTSLGAMVTRTWPRVSLLHASRNIRRVQTVCFPLGYIRQALTQRRKTLNNSTQSLLEVIGVLDSRNSIYICFISHS